MRPTMRHGLLQLVVRRHFRVQGNIHRIGGHQPKNHNNTFRKISPPGTVEAIRNRNAKTIRPAAENPKPISIVTSTEKTAHTTAAINVTEDGISSTKNDV
jgi:hypothetical protein